ncbi:MAG TPA: hypothetical protein V6C86_11265 [Oculatellaceae cyanobacterium]
MSRILIADLQKGSMKLAGLLCEKHELVYTNTVERVLKLLQTPDGFELLIIGVLFDDSRMYELIKEVKSHPEYADMPVMGFSDHHTAMSVSGRDSIESGSHALGVCDYIDTENMSDEEILERINRCLQEKKGIGRKVCKEEETPSEKRVAQEAKRGQSVAKTRRKGG